MYHSGVLIVTIILVNGITSNPTPAALSPPPPVTWPYGRYGMMKAGDRCPDFAPFQQGTRYHDLEDTWNANEWSTNEEGLTGKMTTLGFEMVFCTKNEDGNNPEQVWPAGNYCIHQSGGVCPTGFNYGHIRLDDEDHDNENRIEGTLPGGLYNHNTKYFFCCRHDGVTSNPIDLPITQEFFLYQHTSTHCQTVRGMSVTQEWIHFDTEDDENVDEVFGAHPRVQGSRDFTIYMCFYKSIF